MPRLTPVELRDLLRDALPSEVLEFGATPPPHQFFVPKSHALALGLQIPLVIGDRGMGKSYWWAALQSRDHRTLLARAAPDTRIGADTIVRAGFGPKLLPDSYPSKDVLTELRATGTPPRLIWKTIAIWNILHAVDETTAVEGLEPNALWRDKVAWVVANPEQVDRLLVRADEQLVRSQRDLLLVFDALDTATDDLASFFALIEGLCQLALELRSLRRIRAKVFLRTDQFEDPRVGRFPDAAKLRASTAKLRWLDTELYGLLWSLLGNHPVRGARYRDDLYDTLGSLVRGCLPRQPCSMPKLKSACFTASPAPTWVTPRAGAFRTDGSPTTSPTREACAVLAALRWRSRPLPSTLKPITSTTDMR